MTAASNKPTNALNYSRLFFCRQKTEWLSKAEERELIERISQNGDKRDLSIIQILLNTGLTSGELCSLTWRDVSISLNKPSYLLVRVSGIEPTEHGRTIPLNQQACAAFLNLDYPIHANSEAPIFLGQRGPLTPKGVLQMLKKYVVGTSLYSISIQTLRNTFCRTLLENGMPPKKAASLAGYKNAKAFRRYNLQVSSSMPMDEVFQLSNRSPQPKHIPN